MIDEKEWFRPPNFIRLGMRGDCYCFCWVAEPVQYEGVYGVTFRVGESFAATVCNLDGLYEMLRKAALKELYRRIEAGEKHGEGCMYDEFDWNPILVRDLEGHISIQEPTPIPIELTPVYRARATGLDAKNLYSRPGRFIAVDGPVTDVERPLDPNGPELEPGSGT